MRLPLRCQLGLSGAGGSTSKVSRAHAWLTGAGSLQEA